MLLHTQAGPLPAPVSPPSDIAALNRRFRHLPAIEVLQLAVSELGRVALVSSFGAESVVLLHMLAQTAPDTPVLFLDTGKHFAQTRAYQRRLVASLGLEDVRRLEPAPAYLSALDPDGGLHRRDRDGCCALRKTAPLQDALAGFDGWITGRKRFQTGQRAALEHFESDPGSTRTKINPLAYWTGADIAANLELNHLPRHPLVARGFASIGCEPCTSPVAEGEDARAGRWRSLEKSECGIHFDNGRAARNRGES